MTNEKVWDEIDDILKETSEKLRAVEGDTGFVLEAVSFTHNTFSLRTNVGTGDFVHMILLALPDFKDKTNAEKLEILADAAAFIFKGLEGTKEEKEIAEGKWIQKILATVGDNCDKMEGKKK